ncbi:MAG TPA: phosphatase PAP2 family protein [Cyclobacteriaceae bacterium]|nr:phosphatase PAP2 family protein [Cyclobacteriaceae bacterium]
MRSLKDYWGLYLLAVFFASGIAGVLLFEKGEAELWLNIHWNPIADIFFKYFTYLGDGIAFVILIIFLMFIRYYYIVLTLIVIIIQTLIVQGLKMQIFPDLDRPPFYFRNMPGLHFVEGVELHFNQTFPSGHSATIFAMATILSIAIPNKKLTAVWYLIAILVGISRVYLMQHFFIDIFFGAMIGIGVVCLIHWLLEKTSLKSSILLNKSIR